MLYALRVICVICVIRVLYVLIYPILRYIAVYYALAGCIVFAFELYKAATCVLYFTCFLFLITCLLLGYC